MRNIKKYIVYLVVCMVFTIFTAMSASAAADDEDDEDITKVTLTVTADTSADSGSGTLDVTADSTRFQVESFDFIGGSGDWVPGDIPKVKVVLTAAEGYSFSTRMTSGRVTVKNTGTCKSVKRIDKGASLEVTIELKAIPGTLGTIDDAFWVETPIGKAKWDEAKLASAYQVKLYYKGAVIKTVDKTTVNTFDFYSYMTKPGAYYFKVRAIPRNSSESTYLDTGEWVNSDELYIENEKTAPVNGQNSSNNPSNNQLSSGPSSGPSSSGNSPGAGGTVPSNAGWLSDSKGWKYRDNGGSYVTNNWSFVNGKWYFFDMAGYMELGWQQKNGKYYYFTVNGDMVTGWLEDNKKWYYMGGDGAMVTGWVADGGQWYYTNTDGSMVYGWMNVDKKWYYFNLTNGTMMKDTMIDNRYINGEGVYTG